MNYVYTYIYIYIIYNIILFNNEIYGLKGSSIQKFSKISFFFFVEFLNYCYFERKKGDLDQKFKNFEIYLKGLNIFKMTN